MIHACIGPLLPYLCLHLVLFFRNQWFIWSVNGGGDLHLQGQIHVSSIMEFPPDILRYFLDYDVELVCLPLVGAVKYVYI